MSNIHIIRFRSHLDRIHFNIYYSIDKLNRVSVTKKPSPDTPRSDGISTPLAAYIRNNAEFPRGGSEGKEIASLGNVSTVSTFSFHACQHMSHTNPKSSEKQPLFPVLPRATRNLQCTRIRHYGSIEYVECLRSRSRHHTLLV